MTKFFAALIAIALVVVGFMAFRFLASGTGSRGEQVVFDVPPKKSFHVVAESLEHKGLVSSALLMRVLARITHQGGRVKVGEYALNKGMSPQEILDTLVGGKSILYPITFPEGANIYEMAAALQAKNLFTAAEYLKAVHERAFVRELLGFDASSLEGYLFPETYNVTKFTPLREFITNQVQNFKTTYAALEARAKAENRTPSLSRQELVILASMVEKETGAPEERPLIASVFYNRMAKNMRMQSDPTIIYGIWVETGAYKNNITREDLTHANQYNTYTVARLPAGPISNPGRESLWAVLAPAHSEYLYFVSHNDGTHAFSKTYGEHTQAVKNFQLNPAAREGKSWRDLKKRQSSSK